MTDDVPLPPLAAIPPEIETLADYERLAKQHMPATLWRHIQGGAGEGRSLADNLAAFDRLQLMPRLLADLRGASTAITLFDRLHAAPIMLAPLAYQRLAHPDGELATIRAAMALEIGMIVSTLSSVPLEEIAQTGRHAAAELHRSTAPMWFQLYFQDDRGWSAELVRRAEAAGYEAIVVTVDASIKRSGFTLPRGVEAANLREFPTRAQVSSPGQSILFGTPLVERAPGWKDLAWLREQTKLPLIVKGILAPEDARLAVSHAVDALVVSNHGGRVLDGLPSPLDMLARIAHATSGQVPLLLDGGVRRGTDVVKALALGARAVLLGRPQMHALAVAGMAGVAHALYLLRAELELTMAQLGCRTPGEIGPDRIFVRG